jgi:hypothetical protein
MFEILPSVGSRRNLFYQSFISFQSQLLSFKDQNKIVFPNANFGYVKVHQVVAPLSAGSEIGLFCLARNIWLDHVFLANGMFLAMHTNFVYCWHKNRPMNVLRRCSAGKMCDIAFGRGRLKLRLVNSLRCVYYNKVLIYISVYLKNANLILSLCRWH